MPNKEAYSTQIVTEYSLKKCKVSRWNVGKLYQVTRRHVPEDSSFQSPLWKYQISNRKYKTILLAAPSSANSESVSRDTAVGTLEHYCKGSLLKLAEH